MHFDSMPFLLFFLANSLQLFLQLALRQGSLNGGLALLLCFEPGHFFFLAPSSP